MKLLCDVCNISAATVVCCADQASLCDACDSSIHGANKLSEKHQRLALIHPSSSSHHHHHHHHHHHQHQHHQIPQEDDHRLPLCDICQDKVGYFFCLEDRALLCRECDFSIHSANSISSRHKRFLMTGIQVALRPSDTSESVQTRSPSQKSSSSNTNVSQLSHPSMQISPKSMHRNSKDIQNRPQNVQNSPPNMQLSHRDMQTRSPSIQGSPSRTQISSQTTLNMDQTSPPKQSVPKRKIGKSPILDQQKLRRVPLSKRVGLNNEFSKPHEKQMAHTNGGESSKLHCEKLAVLQNGENSLRGHEPFVNQNNVEEYLKPNQKHMAINYVESLKLHEGHMALNHDEQSLQADQKHMVLNLDEEVLKTERKRMVLNHEELLEPYQEHMVPNISETSFGIGVIPASFQSKIKAIDTLKSSSIPLEFQQQPQLTHYSSKVVGMQSASNNNSSSGVNQQFLINSERHIIDGGTYQSRIDPNYLHKVNSGGAVLAHAGVDNCTRKGSISEYLTQTIPGWKVDEIFSLCDIDTLHNFVNCGSSRPDASNSPDSDLFIDDCSCFDHLVLDRSEAQVPSMASPPTLSGIPRSIKPGVYGKSREELDLGSLLNCDDTLVVPDVGGISSPPESPPLKRRRIYTDLW